MPETQNPYTVGKSALTQSATPQQYVSDSPYGPAKDTSSFAKLSQILLGAQIFLSLASIGFSIKAMVAYSNGTSDALFWDGENQSSFIQIWDGIGQLDVACYILTIIFFCIWVNKSMKNAWALPSSLPKPSFTPGWAVGYYFIPIMMLFKPFQAMREIWVRSDRKHRTSPLVSSWWAFWIIANIFSRISQNSQSSDSVDFETTMVLSVVESTLFIVAATLLILIIRNITRRQIRKIEHSTSHSIQG